jgi:hypothetical protein
MKIINKISFVLIICLLLFSCNDDENNAQNQFNSSLLKNDWQTISQRIVLPDGSTYKLLCETEKFGNDGKWTMTYTGMSGNMIKDSSRYELQADNKTIKFYGYINGVLDANAELSKIKVLNDHLLVYHCLRADGSTWIIDSLGR